MFRFINLLQQHLLIYYRSYNASFGKSQSCCDTMKSCWFYWAQCTHSTHLLCISSTIIQNILRNHFRFMLPLSPYIFPHSSWSFSHIERRFFSHFSNAWQSEFHAVSQSVDFLIVLYNYFDQHHLWRNDTKAVANIEECFLAGFISPNSAQLLTHARGTSTVAF